MKHLSYPVQRNWFLLLAGLFFYTTNTLFSQDQQLQPLPVEGMESTGSRVAAPAPWPAYSPRVTDQSAPVRLEHLHSSPTDEEGIEQASLSVSPTLSEEMPEGIIFALTAPPGGVIGTPDQYGALANQPLSVAAPGFLGNDIDLDGGPLTATAILSSPSNGGVSALPSGSFIYTPDPGFTGTDSFVYQMRDDDSNLSDPVTVTIEVVEGNRFPVGTPDFYTALSNTPLSFAAPGFLGNDIDPDGDVLTATAILSSPSNGGVSALPSGSFIYTPDPGFTGTDSFVYQMRDSESNLSDPVTVTIEVIEGNRPPVGMPDDYAVLENTPLSFGAPGFLGNDIDPDGDVLTATAILSSPSNGGVSALPSGSFIYTPDPGFTGTDSFVYQMRDSESNLSDPVTVTIEVLAVGTLPIGVSDQYGALANQPLSVAAPGFLGNDIDLDGGPLTATAILSSPSNGGVSALPSGSFIYTPDPGFTGTDSFVYQMRDDDSNLSDPVTVTIEVIEGNRPPVGTPDFYTALSNTPLSFGAPGFLGNDIDPDGDVLTATAILSSPSNGGVSALPSGSFIYTPDPGFTGTDSFVYQMRDSESNLSDPVTVTIEVIEGNRPPVGMPDDYATVENTPLSFGAPGFLGNDIDPDGDVLTATAILASPSNGGVSALPSGSFIYTPDPGFTGTDSFVYQMRDSESNLSDPVTVTIEVYKINAPPVANAGPDQMVECTDSNGTPVMLDGSLSSDPDGDPLMYTWRENGNIIAGPTNQAQSVVLFTFGVHTIELTVTDDDDETDTDIVVITVQDTEPPVVSCGGLSTTVPTDPGECEADIDLPVPPATDNCGIAALEYRYRPVNDNNQNIGPWQTGWTDQSNNDVTLAVGRYRVRWRATDPAGHTDFCRYFFEVEDVEPPIITCTNSEVVFNGEEFIDLAVPDLAIATDNCGLASLSLDINRIFCEELGESLNIIATAIDVNGLASTCTSVVDVKGLPCGWSQQPDGVGCENGNDVEYDVPSETFTVNSTDCHNAPTTNTDEYAFAQYNLCGDGEIIAQVTDITGTSFGWAGVIMRESNDPQAKSVALMTNLSANHRREARVTTGGVVLSQLMPSFGRHWLRIQRIGNQFRAYASFDGNTWFLRFAQTILMEECIEVGLVLNGYFGSGVLSASFENVTVQGTTFFEFQTNVPTVELTQSQKAFTVYPNPTAGQVTLALGDFLDQQVRLEVLDVNGQRVQLIREGILESSTEELNLGQLPAGMYFVRLQLADGTVQTRRIVLQPRP